MNYSLKIVITKCDCECNLTMNELQIIGGTFRNFQHNHFSKQLCKTPQDRPSKLGTPPYFIPGKKYTSLLYTREELESFICDILKLLYILKYRYYQYNIPFNPLTTNLCSVFLLFCTFYIFYNKTEKHYIKEPREQLVDTVDIITVYLLQQNYRLQTYCL